MARRTFSYLLCGLLLGVIATLGGLYIAIQQVPEFYADVLEADPEPMQRQEEVKVLIAQTKQLMQSIERTETWQHQITQTQINSWIIEELPKNHPDVLPPNVSQPRINFAQDVVQLGFRVNRGPLSGVVSLQVRPVIKRPNQFEFEIEWVNAGVLPVPIKQLVSDAVESYRSEEWSLDWGTSKSGNDTVILTLNPSDPDMRVDSVRVLDGALELNGHGGGKSAASIVQLTRVP